MILEELKKFGLSTKEAKVYLALLELGTVPVSDIAQKASINRSTAYVILDSLSKSGLVGISDQSGVKLYTAASPERIIQMLDSNIKKYTELISVANKILPQLKSVYKGIGVKPTVQFYEGIEGIKTAFEDTLTSKEPIRAYASIDELQTQMPDYFPNYFKRRATKNIPIKAFFPDTKLARERVTHDKEELRKSILIPQDKYAFSSEINIYDNKVAFFAIKEKFALIIESMEISDGFKKMFDLAWKEKK